MVCTEPWTPLERNETQLEPQVSSFKILPWLIWLMLLRLKNKKQLVKLSIKKECKSKKWKELKNAQVRLNVLFCVQVIMKHHLFRQVSHRGHIKNIKPIIRHRDLRHYSHGILTQMKRQVWLLQMSLLNVDLVCTDPKKH